MNAFKDDNDRLMDGALPTSPWEGARPFLVQPLVESTRSAAPSCSIERLSEGIADFFLACDEKVEYLLEPYVPRRSFVLVQGPPKGGKTWFASWLACEVAKAGKRVVYVQEESAREVQRDRMRPHLPADPLALRDFNDRLRIIFKKRIKLDQAEMLTALIDECKGADLIVLDPFVRLHGAKEKEQDEMAAIVGHIQQLIAETGAAVVLVHHTRKGESWSKTSKADASLEDSRGSGVLAGEVDVAWAVKGVPPSERRQGEVRFIVENPDTRIGTPLEKRVAVIDLSGSSIPLTWMDASMATGESNEQLLERLLPVVPVAPQAISREKLREALRVKKERCRSAVALGISGKKLVEGSHGVSRPDPDPDPKNEGRS